MIRCYYMYVQLKSLGCDIKLRVTPRGMKLATPILDDNKKINSVDKSSMLAFCTDMAKHYLDSSKTANSIKISYPKPDNIIIAGMGGSAIGGDLLKDWARNKTKVPIEVSREYHLPAYANKKTLVLITSYSGDTEESLSAFLDAIKKKCMVFCVSSGGDLLKYAEKFKLPCVQVKGGMPPRAALPHLFAPLLSVFEKMGLVEDAKQEFSEAVTVLKQVCSDNSPNKPSKENPAKTLAANINGTAPLVYGFGFYRSVAQRFKQQFNENCKIPAKWEFFPELDHNEIVGWEKSGDLSPYFSAIFIRDKAEPVEIRSRIETTQKIMQPTGVKMLEVQSRGESILAKMLSTICIGDFTSVYLSVLRGVDPTPVETITHLKTSLQENGVKKKILSELSSIKA